MSTSKTPPPVDPTTSATESQGAELSIEQRATVGLNQGTIVRQRFFRHRGAVISLFVLAFLVLLAFTSVGVIVGGSGDLVVDFTNNTLVVDGYRIAGWWQFDWWSRHDIMLPGGAPTVTVWPFSFGDHPFGQDNTGKDVFARVMRGMQQSLIVTFIVGLLSTVIGVVLGALAGYYRGWIDAIIMRATDVVIIIPLLLLGAVLGRTYGGDAISLSIILGLITWTGMARLVRAEFLSLREREFVDAARVAGASDGRIIFRHILPNTVGVIVVNATLLMSAVILLETSLSYLGFGITQPDISLGQIISEYNEAFKTRPWLFWWPGLFIVIIALCINFIGDGLRDAFDPRQRRVPNKGGAWSEFVTLAKAYLPGGRPTSVVDTSDERKDR